MNAHLVVLYLFPFGYFAYQVLRVIFLHFGTKEIQWVTVGASFSVMN